MVNSIKKGKSFEREIAHLLHETTRCKWQRVPMSGAFSTTNNSEDPRFSGDVFTENPKYKDIVVECKSYKELEINDLFSYKSKFWRWVHQAGTEAKGKRWVMFIKINRRGVYAVAERHSTFKFLNIVKPTPDKLFEAILGFYKLIKVK